MDILNVLKPVEEDNSIVSYEYHHFKPYNPLQISKSDEVRISILNSDLLLHLYEAYLYIEGTITTVKGGAPMVDNWPLFLFSQMRLEINGIEVDSNRNVGLLSGIRLLLCTGFNQQKSVSMHGWYQSKLKAAKSQDFSQCIMLRDVFRIIADNSPVSIFSKIDVSATRARSDDNCFAIDTDGENPEILVTKLELRVPVVRAAPKQALRLYKILESGKECKLKYRGWRYHEFPKIGRASTFSWQLQTLSLFNKPLFVILGFSNGRKDVSTKNFTYFDHLNVRNAKLFVNAFSTPYENQQYEHC